MNVKERCQLADNGTNLGKPPPLIPAMLNTFNNKPFTLLLPAFILDSLGTSIITSLVVFFVRYIVQPEFSNPHLGCKPVGGSSTWMCSSDTVVAASVLAMLGGAFLFVPLWLTAANKLGKRNAWLLWSFSNGLTFLCYAPVGKGDVILCVIMSFFNGAPIGGKFLADTVMADVIDYDEFLTKERAEATYTMFKGFMPKNCRHSSLCNTHCIIVHVWPQTPSGWHLAGTRSTNQNVHTSDYNLHPFSDGYGGFSFEAEVPTVHVCCK